MATVQMRSFGRTLASRHLGSQVRAVLATALRQHGAVTVDFEGVDIAAPGFLHEVFGKLVGEVQGDIALVNVPPEINTMVRYFVRREKDRAAGPRPEATPVSTQGDSQEEV